MSMVAYPVINQAKYSSLFGVIHRQMEAACRLMNPLPDIDVTRCVYEKLANQEARDAVKKFLSYKDLARLVRYHNSGMSIGLDFEFVVRHEDFFSRVVPPKFLDFMKMDNYNELLPDTLNERKDRKLVGFKNYNLVFDSTENPRFPRYKWWEDLGSPFGEICTEYDPKVVEAQIGATALKIFWLWVIQDELNRMRSKIVLTTLNNAGFYTSSLGSFLEIFPTLRMFARPRGNIELPKQSNRKRPVRGNLKEFVDDEKRLVDATNRYLTMFAMALGDKMCDFDALADIVTVPLQSQDKTDGMITRTLPNPPYCRLILNDIGGFSIARHMPLF